MVLVATKVHVPDVRPGLVAREALVARLTGGADRRLSVICAPAGWGKTVLLAQWHASERRPFAWVSLDPSDDDPVRFWSYVIAALRTVVPGFGGAVLAALPNAGPGLVDVVLPRLINELAELPEPVVLVLDDVHVLQDELVHASLAFVIRHLPRTVHLALATRAEPALPLARLRAAGELVELRADELRFADEEADALLNGSLTLGLARGRRPRDGARGKRRPRGRRRRLHARRVAGRARRVGAGRGARAAGARRRPRARPRGAPRRGGLCRRRCARDATGGRRAGAAAGLERREGGADAELSEREIAVLRLLATDLSQREIGSQLYVSFNTVKSHTRTLFRKLGVTSRADAVARGRELGSSESTWVNPGVGDARSPSPPGGFGL